MDIKGCIMFVAYYLLFSYNCVGDVWLVRCVKLNNTVQKPFIYPGTKWCGRGSSAKSYNELGKFSATDSCCRDHDHCGERIYSKETKFGLTNKARFTRMLCQCDAEFYFCLKNVHSYVSRQVGIGYFDLLPNCCFAYTYPIIQCVKRSKIFKWRCLKYELNATQPKKWQWFDLPLF